VAGRAINPKKTKRRQARSKKIQGKKKKFQGKKTWIPLESFVRFGTFQRVAKNTSKESCGRSGPSVSPGVRAAMCDHELTPSISKGSTISAIRKIFVSATIVEDCAH
jgi:hypothetical protein